MQGPQAMQSDYGMNGLATANGELNNQRQRNYTMPHKYMPDDIKRIAYALGKAKKYRSGYMCCCPIHKDREPSLEIWLSDKYPLGLKCYAGCNPKDIIEVIKSRDLLAYNQVSRPAQKLGDIVKSILYKPNIGVKNSDMYNKKRAIKFWKESLGSANTPVETYLRARGVQGDIPSTIRYSPSAKHALTDTYWPCMIAIVTRWPAKKLVAISRTYLAHDGSGKAPIDQNKMMLSSVVGGAVRLTPIGKSNTLIVGEGIETMLSFVEFYSEHAIWAVLSASNYQKLILPELPLVSTIIIAADGDERGIRAAKHAAEKWVEEGRVVKIAIPPLNTDFNDLLLNGRSI